MLYNKNWDAKTITSDPISLESLIAWLEKMPADGTYDWANCDGGCLIGLYAQHIGVPWEKMNGLKADDPYSILVGPGRSVAVNYPRTFGSALIRAREELAER